MDERVAFSEIQEAFGLVARVTRPGDDQAIECTVVWSPTSPELSPGGMEFQGNSSKRVMSIAKAEIDSVPDGSVVLAPEFEGGEVLSWTVDGQERAEFDCWRVMVVPSDE